MRLRLVGVAVVAAIGLVGGAGYYAMASRPKTVPPAPPSYLDRIVIIVLENYQSNKIEPAENGLGQLNPFLNRLATENRLAMNYFGVWKPSLPNYIAMIGGWRQ